MPSDSPAVTPPQPDRSAWKWWVCVMLLLATTLNYMDRQALSQTKVRIGNDLKMDDEQYGRLVLFFNIGFGIGALLFGWLVDKVSLRWLYAGLVIAWSAVGFATGFVTAFFGLVVCRLLLGLFEAGNWPCGIMAVKRVLKPEERSLCNGMFQSGTAIGAILIAPVLALCFAYRDDSRAWQLPFRVIGAAGIFWVTLWLITVRPRHIAPLPAEKDATSEASYWSLWKMRRFYVMIMVIVAVNVPWRTGAEWLPSFLEKGKNYSESNTRWFVAAYYFAADVGSIAAGLITLWMVRRGRSLFGSRMFSFALCATLTTLTIAAVLLPRGPLLIVVILLIGFGALGSFSSYFAFSQEVSARHQGKVTGTLGLINSICMGLLGWFQGWVLKKTGSYTFAYGLTGLAPLLGVLAVWFLWKPALEPAKLSETNPAAS